MKLAITSLLLFTYSTIILKPILPYASDFITHFFWYKDHMTTVHSNNGKFHVHKEMIATSKSSNSEKDSAILKKDVSANDHIITKELNISKEEIRIPEYFFTLSLPLFRTHFFILIIPYQKLCAHCQQ